MRISRIVAKNLRAVKDVTLDCGPLTTLVGRNGAGKSTFLQALDLFYRPTSTLTSEDFHDRAIVDPVVIQLTFADLRPDEREAFRAYIDDGTLSVTKKYVLLDPAATCTGKYYASRMRFSRFTPLRAMGARDMAKSLSEEIERLIVEKILPAGTTKPKTGKDAVAFMDAFESQHPELTESAEDEAQFFGEKNIGGGKLDNFTQFVYVPAVRDVVQDTAEKKAAFVQLLDLLVLRKVNSHPDVAGLPKVLQEAVERVFRPEVLGDDLKKLEAGLNETLRPFVPNAAIALDWGAPPCVSFEPPRVVPQVSEDNFVGDIGKKGHGLQRAIILTLLSQLARTKNTSREQPAEEGGDKSVSAAESASGDASGAARGPDLILGIEEPELYQHPQRCRHFASVLRSLAAAGDPVAPTTQILQTTHSPLFVSLEHFDEVRIIHKQDGCPAYTTVSSESLEALRAEWAKACGKPVEDVTVSSMLCRALRSMTSIVSEGFFADGVVLVEGYGDVGALCEVAKQKGADWVSRGVAVLPVDGKANLGAPVLIFGALDIPAYFVFDGDNHLQGKGKKNGEDCAKLNNHCLLRLGGDPEEDFPSDRVRDRFACFGGNLESYCRTTAGDSYEDIIAEVADEIGWDKADEVLKSTRGAGLFVEKLYGRGKTLPLLEDVVDRATATA